MDAPYENGNNREQSWAASEMIRPSGTEKSRWSEKFGVVAKAFLEGENGRKISYNKLVWNSKKWTNVMNTLFSIVYITDGAKNVSRHWRASMDSMILNHKIKL